MSKVITIRKIKALKARSNTKAETKAKASRAKSRSRARRGDFNILWLIVAIIGVVIGVIVFYFIYAGGMRSMGTTTAPIIQAQAMSGVLTVNIKTSGVGSVDIYGVNLYEGNQPVGSIGGTSSACSSVTYYINGQQQSSFTFPYPLKPGQTLTITASGCSVPVDEITSVQVVTSSGAYTAPVT